MINAEIFTSLRPRMMSVAYRMLGSVAESEDVVQDAFLRLQLTDDVTSPEGFLVRVTTRLCIDRLRANKRRQEYLGPWVPEPVETNRSFQNSALAESLSQAFLLMLERLSPDERAAFLLRTVFDYDYAEIADIVGKSDVHVRQIVSRAKQRLGSDEPRFHPARDEANGLAERFMTACRQGDIQLIERMFTEDIEVHSDGGGKAVSARVVISGRSRSAKFIAGVFRKRQRHCALHATTVNGNPGVVFVSDKDVVLVLSICIEQEICAVYMTSNPDKLERWSVAHIE